MSEIAVGNKGLGEFNLEGIPPAARGTPQIEVTFDIDANGILHVGAKDKATGKENKITIKANSGLTEAEIQKMVKDAEVNAEEDKKVKELAESRNQADALVHSTRKSLTEYGDKLEAGEKDKIEAAIKDVEEAIKGDDKDDIEAKTNTLMTASQKLGEKMYAEAQAAAGTEAAGASASASASAAAADDNVVDAGGLNGGVRRLGENRAGAQQGDAADGGGQKGLAKHDRDFLGDRGGLVARGRKASQPWPPVQSGPVS